MQRRLLPCLLALALLPVSPALSELVQIGVDDQRLSTAGTDGDPNTDAWDSAIAYNATDGLYLVCWESEDGNEGEWDIFCDLLTESGGSLTGGVEISFWGGTNTAYDAYDPAVAWNSDLNEYLVCWDGDRADGEQVDNEFEIFCRRVNENLAPIANGLFRVSSMGGGLGDANDEAYDPTVTYNYKDDRYIVCWEGDQDLLFGGQSDGEFEIFCRTLETDGTLGEQNRISIAGGTEDPDYDAFDPVVVYGSTLLTNSEAVVCWTQDDNEGDLVDGEYEISCARLDGSDASRVGFVERMSEQGPDGDPDYDAFRPTLAFDPIRNVYAVCWEGDDDDLFLAAEGADEIYCGEWDRGLVNTVLPRRLTDVGPISDPAYDAQKPSVAFGGDSWALCYEADEEMPGAHEIWCRSVDFGLSTQSEPPIQVSTMGESPTSTAFDGLRPRVARSSARDHWLVVWEGDDDREVVDGETEIWAQRLDPSAFFADGFESGDTSEWGS